jgi:hypothetical protein
MRRIDKVVQIPLTIGHHNFTDSPDPTSLVPIPVSKLVTSRNHWLTINNEWPEG